MSKHEANLNFQNPEASLVALDEEDLLHQQMLDDMATYARFITPSGRIDQIKALRHSFEERYTEELKHYLLSVEPCPDKSIDPEAYELWRESKDYIEKLATEDLRAAMIVRRLATPIHEKINANQPSDRTRKNKHGERVDENGRDIYMIPEDEFADLEREAEVYAGIVIPLNSYETRDVIDELYDMGVVRPSETLMFEDIRLSKREGGDMYTADGELRHVEPDIEQAREYAELEAEAAEAQDYGWRVMGRYVSLLTAGEQQFYKETYRLKLNG